MRGLISGASGLVGGALSAFLTAGGHAVCRLVRGTNSGTSTDVRSWDPARGIVDPADLEGFDAVVHLGGENIAEGRWTAAKKQRIRDSRVPVTRLLCETLAKCQSPPKVVLVASAIGYYGDRGDQVLTEADGPGEGFLPEVCMEWEGATQPIVARGVRTINLRIGVVLTPAGGALASMLPIFQWGGGGVLGSGSQYMSVISIDDLIGIILHALTNEQLCGPVNAVLPEAVTNREFTRTLGRVLGRPTLFPVPQFAARLALGEMADALLFASTRVVPAKLQASGYQYRYPTLEASLRHVLGRAV